jgi:serine/threonine-protein kinase
MRTQQQAQGVDMRGDIKASMSRLQSELREAQQGLDRNDIGTANEFMDRADREVSALEKFLGR